MEIINKEATHSIHLNNTIIPIIPTQIIKTNKHNMVSKINMEINLIIIKNIIIFNPLNLNTF